MYQSYNQQIRHTAKGRFDTTKQYEMTNSSHTVYIAEIRLS
jgi:hypothetical protein